MKRFEAVKAGMVAMLITLAMAVGAMGQSIQNTTHPLSTTAWASQPEFGTTANGITGFTLTNGTTEYATAAVEIARVVRVTGTGASAGRFEVDKTLFTLSGTGATPATIEASATTTFGVVQTAETPVGTYEIHFAIGYGGSQATKVMVAGMVTYTVRAKPITDFIFALETPPFVGAVAESGITGGTGFGGTVTWTTPALGKDDRFRAATAHVAQIDLVAEPGYFFRGFVAASGGGTDSAGTGANTFRITNVTGATVTNGRVATAGSQTVRLTATFAATDPAGVISSRVMRLAAPVTGNVPADTIVTSGFANAQFTGTVKWSPEVPAGGVFAAETEYTATVTMTPISTAHAFTGTQGTFTIHNPSGANHAAGTIKNQGVTYVNGSNVVTVAFEETDGLELIAATMTSSVEWKTLGGITKPVAGERPVWVIDPVVGTEGDHEGHTLYTGTVTWTPTLDDHGRFRANTAYTAHVALTAGPKYTFDGFEKDDFEPVTGAVPSTTLNPLGTGTTLGVTAVFPVTTPTVLVNADHKITIADLAALTNGKKTDIFPAAGSRPSSWFVNGTVAADAITEEWYTGTIEWSPKLVDGVLVAGTDYDVTVTLSARPGFTFAGTPANSMTIVHTTPANVNAGPSHPNWIPGGSGSALWTANASLDGATVHPAGTGETLVLTTVFRVPVAPEAPVLSFLDVDGDRTSTPEDVVYNGRIIEGVATSISLDFETDHVPTGAYTVALSGDGAPALTPQTGGLFVRADGTGTLSLNVLSTATLANHNAKTVTVTIQVPGSDGSSTPTVATFQLIVGGWAAVTSVKATNLAAAQTNFAMYPLNLASYAKSLVTVTGGGTGGLGAEDITWDVVTVVADMLPPTSGGGACTPENDCRIRDAAVTNGFHRDNVANHLTVANFVQSGTGNDRVRIVTNDDGEPVLTLGSTVALGTAAITDNPVLNRRFIALKASIAGGGVERATYLDTVVIELTPALLGGIAYNAAKSNVNAVTGFGYEPLTLDLIEETAGTHSITLPSIADLTAKIGGSPTYVTTQTGSSGAGLPTAVDGSLVQPRLFRVKGNPSTTGTVTTMQVSGNTLTFGVNDAFAADNTLTFEIPVNSTRVLHTGTDGALLATVTFKIVDTPEAQPDVADIKVDYVNNRLTGLVASRNYEVNSGTEDDAWDGTDTVTATAAGEIAIKPEWVPESGTFQDITLSLLERNDDWAISIPSGDIEIRARRDAPDVYEREISGTEGIISGLLVLSNCGPEGAKTEACPMEYKLRTATSWTTITSAMLTNHELKVPHGVYEVRFAAIKHELKADGLATLVQGEFSSEITELVIGGAIQTETQPNVNDFVINFADERLGGLVASRVYRVMVGTATTTTNVTANAQGSVAIATGWYGENIRIILAGSGEIEDSPASLPFLIPARPATPAVVGEDINNDDPEEVFPGTLTGLTTAMEYRLLPATEWVRVTSAMISGGVMEVTDPGTYQVRVVSTSTAFSSAAASIEIKLTTPVGIVEVDREDPVVGGGEDVAAFVPVRSVSKFAAGPSPVQVGGVVNFFGGTGTLRVFDALGNVVRTVKTADGWDLKDASGRNVSEGTYIVRGVVTVDGSPVRVSVPVTVVK